MTKITQNYRIERIFSIRDLPALVTFTSKGQTLTVVELALKAREGGSGRSQGVDDAFLVLTNVGDPCGITLTRGPRAAFDGVLPTNGTIVIDLANPFALSWSGPLHAVAAYLPRYAIFEGDERYADDHSIVDARLLEDDLLCAIMGCLRHTAAPTTPHEFEVFARQLLAAVCSCLARNHTALLAAPRLTRVALSDEQKQSAIEYMVRNLESGLSMPKVAAACGLPYRLFIRAFKHSLGASPHDWVMATRLERAKRLMLQPSLRLSDIALMVGFCDQSHFNRVFARFTACTPGEWRRNRLSRQRRTTLRASA